MTTLETIYKVNPIEDAVHITTEIVSNNMIETAPVNLISGSDMNKSTYDTNFNGVVDTCEYIDCGTF